MLSFATRKTACTFKGDVKIKFEFRVAAIFWLPERRLAMAYMHDRLHITFHTDRFTDYKVTEGKQT